MIRCRAVMLLLLTSFLILYGCKGLKDNPKYAFADGVYHSRVQGKKSNVYIENTNDSIIVYSLKKGWQRLSLKASSLPKQSFPQKSNAETIRANRYWQNGFDIDILTIPLKFRPSAQSFPRQFSNNLNGAVYLGFRNDTYQLSYNKNPIGQISQKIKHYGISAGVITGLGATAMNPYVTNNQIAIEYDGMIWSKGIAVIMGVDNFTFGIIGGIDHLLDKNSAYWLYNGKPYLGLAVGLNLN